MSYHMRDTGSARSVGPRRRKKLWQGKTKNYVSRSAAGARRQAAAEGDTLLDVLPTPAAINMPLGPVDKPKAAAGGGGGTGGGTGGNTAGGTGGGTGGAVPAPGAQPAQHNPNPPPQLDLTANNAAAAAEANIVDLQANNPAASPNTAWKAGQFVTIGDSSKAHWDGTAWAAGAAT